MPPTLKMMMDTTLTTIPEIQLIGLDLGRTTTNENGQSSKDGGKLWHTFESGQYADRIQNKTSEEIYAVYYGYEGDHTAPFRYFIGCSVEDNSSVPEGMNRLTIPEGKYQKITASGRMPDCMVSAWKEIWSSDLERSYRIDFECYDERSKNWEDAMVDIYLS